MEFLHIRRPAVAGLFYPESETELRDTVDGFLAEAEKTRPSGPLRPKALIVPHAGYVFSGPVAASAYLQLKPLRAIIRRVVLLGPAHRAPVEGLALPRCDYFETPLGRVKLDQAACRAVLDLPQVTENAQVHAPEHSLEVQLPFLQRTLENFEFVPLAVGDASAPEVHEAIEILWGGPETLILVSSDLSHYLPYKQAQAEDAATAKKISDLDAPFSPLGHGNACGATPVNGLLLAAREHRLRAYVLDLRNSGDTAGDRDRVVGYGSFAFTEKP
ncbi:MAG: AmmeMemoRadiSam system protein B [Pseudomonadota bacterium]